MFCNTDARTPSKKLHSHTSGDIQHEQSGIFELDVDSDSDKVADNPRLRTNPDLGDRAGELGMGKATLSNATVLRSSSVSPRVRVSPNISSLACTSRVITPKRCSTPFRQLSFGSWNVEGLGKFGKATRTAETKTSWANLSFEADGRGNVNA